MNNYNSIEDIPVIIGRNKRVTFRTHTDISNIVAKRLKERIFVNTTRHDIIKQNYNLELNINKRYGLNNSKVNVLKEINTYRRVIFKKNPIIVDFSKFKEDRTGSNYFKKLHSSRSIPQEVSSVGAGLMCRGLAELRERGLIEIRFRTSHFLYYKPLTTQKVSSTCAKNQSTLVKYIIACALKRWNVDRFSNVHDLQINPKKISNFFQLEYRSIFEKELLRYEGLGGFYKRYGKNIIYFRDIHCKSTKSWRNIYHIFVPNHKSSENFKLLLKLKYGYVDYSVNFNKKIVHLAKLHARILHRYLSFNVTVDLRLQSIVSKGLIYNLKDEIFFKAGIINYMKNNLNPFTTKSDELLFRYFDYSSKITLCRKFQERSGLLDKERIQCILLMLSPIVDY